MENPPNHIETLNLYQDKQTAQINKQKSQTNFIDFSKDSGSQKGIIDSGNVTITSFRGNQFNRLNIPPFLIKQMPLKEHCKLLNYLCCCICCNRRNRIENIKAHHLETFFDSSQALSCDYNINEPAHEKSLQYLYLSVIKSDLTDNLISNEWKVIGFNTDNPRNEFQKGGYLALLFINSFIRQYDEEFKIMISNMNVIIFNFVMNCILVAYYTKLALNLLNEDDDVICNKERKDNKIKLISISQFIVFTDKQGSDNNYIFSVMSTILIHLFRKYSNESKKNKKHVCPSVNPMFVREVFNKIFYDELNVEEGIFDEESDYLMD
jgi:hypothetical protein